MNKATVHPDKVLIRINAEERRRMFEKDIVRDDGKVISLVTSIQSNPDEESFFTQSVQVGDVIGVGSNVSWVKEGDRAILDYTVDINSEHIVYAVSDKDKTVCINAISRYHDSDFLIPANRKRQFDQYVYRSGDLDVASMLIGVIRDGELIPNFPYTILAYREPKKGFNKSGNNIYMMEYEESVFEREVIAVHNHSKLKVGDIIVVQSESLFDRNADGKLISIIYDHDILAISTKSIL